MACFTTQQQGVGGQKLPHCSSSNSKAAGLAASKVIYRRRRVSRRVPTTILETTCTDFRDTVQKLTGVHPPAGVMSSRQLPKCTNVQTPGFQDEDFYRQLSYEDDAQVAPEVHSSAQSVLRDPASELPDSEFFQHFLRSNTESRNVLKHDDRTNFDAAVPSLRGARFPSYPNMPPRGVYRQQLAPNGIFRPPCRSTMPLLWEGIGSDYMSSMPKLHDPSLDSNPYLMALENQLYAKFAMRMQFAVSNSLDPWYRMDHIGPMHA